jgi:hypothetical protein
MMAATNIRNLKINISENLMHIRRRKGTQNPSPMPSDPKEKREENERNAHIVTKDSIRNPHACKKKYIRCLRYFRKTTLEIASPRVQKKKKPEDLNSKKGNSSHALIAINSSPDAWIIYLGASHHMATSEEVYSSLDAWKGPPILMGDNSSVEVTGKGRIELTNGSFENVLHVPKLSVNLLSMYQMMNSMALEINSYSHQMSMDIYDMQTSSRVATSEVNHQSRLYTFSEFIEPDSALLRTHVDESSRIWHERFGHLNFRYMQ